MWRPQKLGKCIAKRELRLRRRRTRARTVTVSFGQPVRSPRSERGDPWWCPIEITGLGRKRLSIIPGEDSLQALILAFEYVSNILPFEAERVGGNLEWLGERERLVFANSINIRLASRALQNLVNGVAAAVTLLENGKDQRSTPAKKLLPRLRTLIASGGYTAER